MRNKAYSILLFAGIFAIPVPWRVTAESATIYVADNYSMIQQAVSASAFAIITPPQPLPYTYNGHTFNEAMSIYGPYFPEIGTIILYCGDKDFLTINAGKNEGTIFACGEAEHQVGGGIVYCDDEQQCGNLMYYDSFGFDAINPAYFTNEYILTSQNLLARNTEAWNSNGLTETIAGQVILEANIKSGEPATIYVPDDYTTIQAAVDAANPGDTIVVRDGTYTENVNVNKDQLTIRSENGGEVTIVQAANSNDYVFELTADYVNIDGFTVKGSTTRWSGAGIYLYHVVHCCILNSDLLNNWNGISLQGVSDSTVNKNNVYSNNWNGIHISYSHNNLVINNRASTNPVRGIQLWQAGDNTIVHNILSNNNEGISVFGSPNNTIANNKILGNYYGIWLEYFAPNDNFIYLNNFIDNNFNANIWNPPLTNTWNSPDKTSYTYNGNTHNKYLGNYWDDYAGADGDGDGIGDTPYPIYGDYWGRVGDKPVVDNDNYPLMMPFENYEIGPEGERPGSPINPAQLKSDGLTEIPVGAVTNEPTVVFKANLTDPDGDNVKLQIELRRLDEYEGRFLNEFTKESDFVTSGSEVTITVYGLIDGNYHWQARAVDEKGLASEWVEFGDNDISEVDFAIVADVPSEQPVFKAPWRGEKRITQGNNGSRSHYDGGAWDNTYAIDVALYKEDVLAPADGNVFWSGDAPSGVGGEELVLRHIGPTGKEFFTVYLHLAAITVRKGDPVIQGQLVAKSGNTGGVPYHLHFHLWRPKGSEPEWAYALHTMPIERLIMKQVGVDTDFREYDARKGDFDDAKIEISGRYFESNNAVSAITITAHSPVDLVVTDPEGLRISKQLNEVLGATYFEYDANENGELNDIVDIPNRKIGNYLIQVIPESNALPSDIYSLEVTSGGQTLVLDQDVQIEDIPPQPYVFVSRLNPSDFDADGDVDILDLGTLSLHWFSQDCNYPDWCEGTDLDKSGLVNFTDFAELANHWLEGI